MDHGRVLEAFGLEAGRLTEVIEGLSEEEWDRPTACDPWRVRDLLAHIRVTIARLPGMLAEEPPDRAEISAVEYYRPDERFSAGTNAARIALAQEQAAAQGDGKALAGDFAATWREVHRLCREEPADRVVRTRHGDAMLLSQFLITRVVEVGVHGLDLAAALNRAPWLTPQAGAVLEELLLGRADTAAVRALGWDQVTFLYKATGRAPIDAAEREQVERMGIRWLTLG